MHNQRRSFDCQELETQVFILHYSKNTERYGHVRFLTSHFPKAIIISEFDREDYHRSSFYTHKRIESFVSISSIAHILLNNIMQIRHRNDLAKESHSANDTYKRYQSPVEVNPLAIARICPGILSDTNLSLNLKHRHAWELLTMSSHKYAFIMEDDIILQEDSIQRLERLLASLGDRYDYVDIAGGCGLQPFGSGYCRDPLSSDLFVLEHPSTRTTCGYIIHRRMAERLITGGHDILFPIDFQLTYLLNLYTASTGWVEPPIMLHGSEHGFFATSNPPC